MSGDRYPGYFWMPNPMDDLPFTAYVTHLESLKDEVRKRIIRCDLSGQVAARGEGLSLYEFKELVTNEFPDAEFTFSDHDWKELYYEV